jgi:hypothetical protein
MSDVSFSAVYRIDASVGLAVSYAQDVQCVSLGPMSRDNFSTMPTARISPLDGCRCSPEILRFRHDLIADFGTIDFFLGKVCRTV